MMRERMRQTEKVRKFVLEWFFFNLFFYDRWMTYMPSVSHPF